MPKAAKTDPQIIEMPAQLMAAITTVGDPNELEQDAFKALYGAVYTLKFALKKEGKDFKVTGLRARWPDAHLVPKSEWIGHWGLPIPEGTTALTQKVPGVEVKIERWEYGTVAQILHIGSYSEEGPTVERLHRFVNENGYELAGEHEEEYLTRPTAKVMKTIIRYPIKRKA